jgi:hypothetical protein
MRHCTQVCQSGYVLPFNVNIQEHEREEEDDLVEYEKVMTWSYQAYPAQYSLQQILQSLGDEVIIELADEGIH